MLALARYVLKGQYQAATIVGLLASIGAVLPLLSGGPFSVLVATGLVILSSALVGLVILTQGSISGLKAIVVSILGITIVATIVLKAPMLGVSIGFAQWLPIIILAQVLRTTKSLVLMLFSGLVLAVIAVALQFLIWPDLEANMILAVEESFAELKDRPEYQGIKVGESLEALALVHFMVLMLGSVMYLLYVAILLLSRSMQARLAETDGFKAEFEAITFGKNAAFVSIVLLAVSFWLKQDWMTSIAFLLITLFLFQGIAVVQTKISRSKRSKPLFILFYVLLLIFPQVIAITAIVGLLDNWLILRKPANIEST